MFNNFFGGYYTGTIWSHHIIRWAWFMEHGDKQTNVFNCIIAQINVKTTCSGNKF